MVITKTKTNKQTEVIIVNMSFLLTSVDGWRLISIWFSHVLSLEVLSFAFRGQRSNQFGSVRVQLLSAANCVRLPRILVQPAVCILRLCDLS